MGEGHQFSCKGKRGGHSCEFIQEKNIPNFFLMIFLIKQEYLKKQDSYHFIKENGIWAYSRYCLLFYN
jgi:hypothetical protein